MRPIWIQLMHIVYECYNKRDNYGSTSATTQLWAQKQTKMCRAGLKKTKVQPFLYLFFFVYFTCPMLGLKHLYINILIQSRFGFVPRSQVNGTLDWSLCNLSAMSFGKILCLSVFVFCLFEIVFCVFFIFAGVYSCVMRSWWRSGYSAITWFPFSLTFVAELSSTIA